jgi:hypothetical protein
MAIGVHDRGVVMVNKKMVKAKEEMRVMLLML